MSKIECGGFEHEVEDVVDTICGEGRKGAGCPDAIQNALDAPRAAHDRDPDTPEDQSDDVIEEPSNDHCQTSQLSTNASP